MRKTVLDLGSTSPLHPQLIDLGFVDYVTAQKKSKRGRLFWELSEDRDGFASHVSRHYNQRFLPAVLGCGKNTPKSSIAQDTHSSTNSTLKRWMRML